MAAQILQFPADRVAPLSRHVRDTLAAIERGEIRPTVDEARVQRFVDVLEALYAGARAPAMPRQARLVERLHRKLDQETQR